MLNKANTLTIITTQPLITSNPVGKKDKTMLGRALISEKVTTSSFMLYEYSFANAGSRQRDGQTVGRVKHRGQRPGGRHAGLHVNFSHVWKTS